MTSVVDLGLQQRVDHGRSGGGEPGVRQRAVGVEEGMGAAMVWPEVRWPSRILSRRWRGGRRADQKWSSRVRVCSVISLAEKAIF